MRSLPPLYFLRGSFKGISQRNALEPRPGVCTSSKDTMVPAEYVQVEQLKRSDSTTNNRQKLGKTTETITMGKNPNSIWFYRHIGKSHLKYKYSKPQKFSTWN